MQTLHIDGTTYRVKFDRDPLELAKLARKPYKPKKPKDIRRFPVLQGVAVSTAGYIRHFDALNNLRPVDYHGASEHSAVEYDSTIPLFEVLNDDE